MNWLMPVLTFALGLSISAALFFWRQAARRHGDSERTPTEPVQVEGSVDTAKRAIGAVGQAPSHRFGFENPRKTFTDAFRKGDVESAIAQLPALRDVLGEHDPAFLLSAGVLASVGRKDGLPFLLSSIRSEQEFDDEDVLQNVIASAVQYYVTTDREEEGLNEIGELIRKRAYDESRSGEVRAYIANQLQMLYYGSGRLDEALRTIEYVIENAPEDASYYFNRSFVLEGLGRLDEAVRDIEKCVDLDASDDEDHLYRSVHLYAKTGDIVKMKAVEEKLKNLV